MTGGLTIGQTAAFAGVTVKVPREETCLRGCASEDGSPRGSAPFEEVEHEKPDRTDEPLPGSLGHRVIARQLERKECDGRL